MLPAGGNPIYYVEDLLGTSRVITTNTGVVCYDADFYPYGGERAYTNTCPQNYKFEGKERDTETGNDDFGARYYSNRFGRWLSADWSSVPVPVPYANLTNPQTLNLYSMVADDPESFADLDGHCCSNDDIDFGMGVLRGIASSVTFGAVGAPKATDSPSSLAGQLSGTGVAGIAGEVIKNAGADAVGVGLVAELPSGGTSTLVVAGGGAGVVAGQAVEVGAAANLARIAAAGHQASAAETNSGKETGSYTNTHESGKTYSGKGDRARSQASGKRVEKQTGDKHTATDWTPSPNERQAFKDESRRIDSNGGANSTGNHNKIESPGKKYRKEDGPW